MDRLRLGHDGAELARGAAMDDLPALRSLAAGLPQEQAGVRLSGRPELAALVGSGSAIGRLVADRLGRPAFPVRALLFDKSAGRNWSLAWHQDRTIVVRERIEVDGFGPWTRKAGLQHVAPPAAVLERMLTVRIHLDDVPAGNAPLLIAPGSHRLGRIAEAELAEVVDRCGTIACLAEAGDVWLYATLVLHASEAAITPTRRRVLQVDFAADDLPGGLRWLGV